MFKLLNYSYDNFTNNFNKKGKNNIYIIYQN